jgi:hypothetical protein
LRLSWALRGDLELPSSLLGNKRFPGERVQICLERHLAFGGHFGCQNQFFCYFWGHVLDQFLNTFWTTFELIFGLFLVADVPQMG